jgi:hypothetical protein
MRQQARQQKSLFEEREAKPTPRLPADVLREVAQLHRQWMQELAEALAQECSDE